MQQPNLQKLLDDYRDHNIRPSFDFRPYTELPLIGIKRLGMEDAVEALKAQAEQANRPLYILPINSWYRKVAGEDKFSLKTLNDDAAKFSQWSEIPVLKTVMKVNYTNNTGSHESYPISYFAGHIPPNSLIIPMDDLIGGGSTYRDIARFISSSGSEVAAFSCIDYGDIAGSYSDSSSKLIGQNLFASMYGFEHKITEVGVAKEAYAALSEQEKIDFVKKCEERINPILEKAGRSLGQLVADELDAIMKASMFYGRYADNFLKRNIAGFEAAIEEGVNRLDKPSVPRAETVHKPDELAEFIIRTRTTTNDFIAGGKGLRR